MTERTTLPITSMQLPPYITEVLLMLETTTYYEDSKSIDENAKQDQVITQAWLQYRYYYQTHSQISDHVKSYKHYNRNPFFLGNMFDHCVQNVLHFLSMPWTEKVTPNEVTCLLEFTKHYYMSEPKALKNKIQGLSNLFGLKVKLINTLANPPLEQAEPISIKYNDKEMLQLYNCNQVDIVILKASEYIFTMKPDATKTIKDENHPTAYGGNAISENLAKLKFVDDPQILFSLPQIYDAYTLLVNCFGNSVADFEDRIETAFNSNYLLKGTNLLDQGSKAYKCIMSVAYLLSIKETTNCTICKGTRNVLATATITLCCNKLCPRCITDITKCVCPKCSKPFSYENILLWYCLANPKFEDVKAALQLIDHIEEKPNENNH